MTPHPDPHNNDSCTPAGFLLDTARAYEDALLQGLSHEGAMEVAAGVGSAARRAAFRTASGSSLAPCHLAPVTRTGPEPHRPGDRLAGGGRAHDGGVSEVPTAGSEPRTIADIVHSTCVDGRWEDVTP